MSPQPAKINITNKQPALCRLFSFGVPGMFINLTVKVRYGRWDMRTIS